MLELGIDRINLLSSWPSRFELRDRFATPALCKMVFNDFPHLLVIRRYGNFDLHSAEAINEVAGRQA